MLPIQAHSVSLWRRDLTRHKTATTMIIINAAAPMEPPITALVLLRDAPANIWLYGR